MRGRGLKYRVPPASFGAIFVALFARAWIEIFSSATEIADMMVALFARAWIEIFCTLQAYIFAYKVALFARAWIEIQAP